MCSRRTSAPARQRGVALVVALLVFALCAILMVGMQSEFNLFHQRVANHLLAEQGDAYLRGAEQLAALALQADHDADQRRGGEPRDDLREIWARDPTPYPLEEGGWLVGGLEDLQGRFNLNWLVPAEPPESGEPRPPAERLTPAQRVFVRLLQSLGEASLSLDDAIALTLAIGDWVDDNALPLTAGSEDDAYLGRTPAYRAANRPMASASELRAVTGMNPALFQALLPVVTVWPRDGAASTLNIHTAPLPVLRALGGGERLEPLSEAEGQALLSRQREEGGFASLEDFLASPVFENLLGGDRETLEALLGEASDWFLLSAEVEVAERRLRLYSVLHRDQRSVRAVTRAYGSP